MYMCLDVCMYHLHVEVSKDEEKVLVPLELELQMVLSSHLGAGN